MSEADKTETKNGRTTRERLGALLGRREEALSPWVLRLTLRELQHVVDPTVSEVEGGRRAAGVAGWYASATPEQQAHQYTQYDDQHILAQSGLQSVNHSRPLSMPFQ